MSNAAVIYVLILMLLFAHANLMRIVARAVADPGILEW
jgi:hypothetical protein